MGTRTAFRWADPGPTRLSDAGVPLPRPEARQSHYARHDSRTHPGCQQLHDSRTVESSSQLARPPDSGNPSLFSVIRATSSHEKLISPCVILRPYATEPA